MDLDISVFNVEEGHLGSIRAPTLRRIDVMRRVSGVRYGNHSRNQIRVSALTVIYNHKALDIANPSPIYRVRYASGKPGLISNHHHTFNGSVKPT